MQSKTHFSTPEVFQNLKPRFASAKTKNIMYGICPELGTKIIFDLFLWCYI
ncbi:hypothetical protein GCM10010917_11780 [Paenibacillus physcomitrellae]|uniref:Uncharacterized protein n=1 Tax=Paenibacillus physcomitrellae TaxID=1619311 RepID=A0ABQ1FRU4_9BACL|nr:hypothetical protein GCM10010917_11780 [Paenibacillus physcomitrellae]